MATNRGAYDPRQFLHYPDKDPFSDVAQRRLDSLIQDFLNTGIAFANGASVRSVNAEDRRGNVDLFDGDLHNATHQAHQTSGDATVSMSEYEEEEGFESKFSKADKGKGRDEREGPGLKGLWSNNGRFSLDFSPPGPSAYDAASFLSRSGSQDSEGSNGVAEDRDGFFEDVHENEELDEGLEGDEEEDGPDDSAVVSGHNSSPSSEQEIIYIGDSDEEDEPQEAMSDTEAGNAFKENHEWMRGDIQDDDSEKGQNWGSGSEFAEEEERIEVADAWNYSVQGQDADDTAQEPEWHQSQGKESDDEAGYVEIDGCLHGDEGDNDSDRRLHIGQPRRYFVSRSLADPWASSSTTATKISSLVLAPAAWGAQSSQEHGDDRMEMRSEVDGTEEIQIASFESVRDPVRPEVIDDAEAHESGPPPELQSAGHMQEITSSFTPGITDLTGMGYILPITELDTVLSEHGAHSRGPGDWPSADSSQAIDIPHIDTGTEPAVPQDLDDTSRAFLSSLTSPELQVDAEVVLRRLDVSPRAIAASIGTDHHGHEKNSADPETTPALSHVQELSTIDDDASELFADHSTVAQPPRPSFMRQRNSDGSGIASGNLEKTHASDEGDSPLRSTLASKTVLVEPTLLHSPATPPIDSSVLQSHDHSSSIAEEDSNDDTPSKPVLLHPAVFDNQELTHTPAHTEAQCQSPLSTISRGCADNDIEIHDMNDTLSDRLIVTAVVSEPEEDSHNIEDVPEAQETLVITTVVSEPEEDSCDTQDVLETLDTEEVEELRSGDVIFSEYVVCEPVSGTSPMRSETTSLPNTLEDGAQKYDDILLSRLAPAISAGSDTPSLSPTATVTNSSSAPDPSIATSDLSTVNQAPVSVVTSTGSPPPRGSTTHADIRQPLTHVGYASDDDQNSGDGFSVLPDPRLPPEPTHLGIPVGVVGRSLADDKEERAESMKVEPPRSESEGGSLIGEGRNKHGAEGTAPAQGVEQALQTFQEDATEPKTVVNDASVDEMMTTEANIPDTMVEKEKDEASNEIIYPDSISDRLSHVNGEEQVPQIPTEPRNTSATQGCNTSQSLPSSPIAAEPPLHILSGTNGSAATAIVHDTNMFPKPSSEDNTSHVVNGRIWLSIDTENFCQTENGTEIEQISESSPADGPNANDTGNSAAVPSIPSGRECVSSAKPESKSRRSTRSKSRAKVVEPVAVSPPPPPQSIIYARSKRSPASLKRPRPFEAFTEPSKHRRLTRSPTATKSSSFSGDTPSPGTFDDKSDVSSISCSSSAVSRLLFQRGKSSSLSSLSPSPSIKSQPSPISAEHPFTVPPSIRKYVPHNHNHTLPASPSSGRASVERTTQMRPKPTLPTSPIPQPPQPSSTHQTRASCTDHKISIPGPDSLLYFLVPRCSLLDPEVEKDVSIVDCGVATREEVERAVGDLEAVYLDSTTLGVIRQLAGIQLMREGQVGYLPRLGESLRHEIKHGRSQVHHVSSAQNLPRKVDSSTPTKTGSLHRTSLSLELATSPASTSGPSFSDLTDENVSPSKSSKTSQADYETYEATSQEGKANNPEERSTLPLLPSPKSTRSPKVIGSRRRKLKPEDAAYKPEIEATESSTDNETIGGKKKARRPSKRKMEGSTQGDCTYGNIGTPPKRRKRRHTEQPDNLEGSQDDTPESRRKKIRRKKLDDSHAEDNVTTPT